MPVGRGLFFLFSNKNNGFTGAYKAFNRYSVHNFTTHNPTKPLVFLGQYSIVYEALALHLVGALPRSTTIYVEKHFTENTHSVLRSALWGQKPPGTPLVMEHILEKLSKADYVKIEDVTKARYTAIAQLRAAGFTVNTVEKIDSLELVDDSNGKKVLQISATTMGSGVPSKPHQTSIYNENPESTIINGLRSVSLLTESRLSRVIDAGTVFSLDPNKNKCPKVIFGLGPSAIWLKEIYFDVAIKFLCLEDPKEKLSELALNFRNKKTVSTIDLDRDVIRMSGAFPSLYNASSFIELQDESASPALKKEVEHFLNKYPEIPSEEIVVVLDKNRKNIVAMGQGINATGYMPNKKVMSALPEEYVSTHVINAQISPRHELEHTIAPPDIFGSVLHSMDWQTISVFLKILNLSNNQLMLLMPIERLFFRAKEHGEIISTYMQDVAGVKIAPAFYQQLHDEIRSQKEGPLTINEAKDIVVAVFRKMHSEGEAQQFERALDDLMNKKSELFLNDAPKAQNDVPKKDDHVVERRHLKFK